MAYELSLTLGMSECMTVWVVIGD